MSTCIRVDTRLSVFLFYIVLNFSSYFRRLLNIKLKKILINKWLSSLHLKKNETGCLPSIATILLSLPSHTNITGCHLKHTFRRVPWLALGNRFQQKLLGTWVEREGIYLQIVENKSRKSLISRSATGITKFSIPLSTFFYVNTFAATYLNTQGLNNSCLKSPASTLVDLTFQSRALRSFSLNQLRNLSL